MTHHVLDHSQEFAADGRLPLEEVIVPGIGEYHRSDSLLDGDGPTAVLDFNDLGVALPFCLEHLSDERGPTEDGGEREMHGVMVAIAVSLMRVVSQFVSKRRAHV